MKTWNREGYSVQEQHDGQFEVIGDNGQEFGIIVTGSIEEHEAITSALNNGECVNG